MTPMRLRAIPGLITLIAAAMTLAIVTAPSGAALAEEQAAVHEAEVFVEASQTFTAPVEATTAHQSHEDFTVTLISVVGWPTVTGAATEVSSPFGKRSLRMAGVGAFHEGVDLTPGAGTAVLAIADAHVVSAGWAEGTGETVTLSSTIDGVQVTTVYGHMQTGSLRVAEGMTVGQGDTIGLVGSTGISTGAHLHFEVWEAGQLIEPLSWIRSHANTELWAGLG